MSDTVGNTPTIATLPPPSSSKNTSSSHTANSTYSFSTSSLMEQISSSTRQIISSAPNSSSFSSATIGNLLPTASLTHLTTRKFTLPDKTTASQVLMYRQLLHTNCKPGLRLSRAFQGTTAQKAVMHMPWWEEGVERTGKMVISYDNLVTRLWLNGAILPFPPEEKPLPVATDLLSPAEAAPPTEEKPITLLDDKGLPPVPHPYWQERLGFQQDDPVTDFRSGGVLSLALLVHLAESCPNVHRRFVDGGNASVLPYALTSINVTDMMAKILMFSKSVDKIDALLTSKPFWRMFSDPNALLALHELSMDMLCDVVEEMENADEEETRKGVTVFDFPQILEKTEKRIKDDLLGSGPRTVEEMRSVRNRLKIKYAKALERKLKGKQRQVALEKNLESQRIQALSVMTGAAGVAAASMSGAANTAAASMSGAANTAAASMSGAANTAAGAMTGAAGVAAGAAEELLNRFQRAKAPDKSEGAMKKGKVGSTIPDFLDDYGYEDDDAIGMDDSDPDWMQYDRDSNGPSATGNVF